MPPLLCKQIIFNHCCPDCQALYDISFGDAFSLCINETVYHTFQFQIHQKNSFIIFTFIKKNTHLSLHNTYIRAKPFVWVTRCMKDIWSVETVWASCSFLAAVKVPHSTTATLTSPYSFQNWDNEHLWQL